jgi:diguanylate cyclase (GGDEF)-like protein
VVLATALFETKVTLVQATRRQAAVHSLRDTFSGIAQQKARLETYVLLDVSDERFLQLAASLRQDILVALDQHARLLEIGAGSAELDSDLNDVFARFGAAMRDGAKAAADDMLRGTTLVLNQWEDLDRELSRGARSARTRRTLAIAASGFLLLVFSLALAVLVHRATPETETVGTEAAKRAPQADRDGLFDALTKVGTRQSFLSQARQEVSRCRRYSRSLSFVGVDVRGLKHINQSEGIGAGDYVLQTIGEILQHNTRSSDWVGRIGDDSFGVLLPETEVDGATYLAEKLQRNIDVYPFDLTRDVSVRTAAVSLGDEEDAEAVLHSLEARLADSG